MSSFSDEEYNISKLTDLLNGVTFQEKIQSYEIIEKLHSIQNDLLKDLGLSKHEINSLSNSITDIELIVAMRIKSRCNLSLETIKQFIQCPNAFTLLSKRELN